MTRGLAGDATILCSGTDLATFQIQHEYLPFILGCFLWTLLYTGQLAQRMIPFLLIAVVIMLVAHSFSLRAGR